MHETDYEKYEIRELSREAILTLYQETAPLHFPREELRSRENLISLLDRNGYQGLGIYPGPASKEASPKSLLGYALFIQVPGQSTGLLDFYAVMEEYRDLGLGSIFLQGIREHYGKKGLRGLYIETEDISFASSEYEAKVRHRRNTFYERNGASPAGFGTTVFDVPFSIYYLPTAASPDSSQDPAAVPADNIDKICLQKGLERIYRFMLPPALYKQKVLFRR